MIRLSSKYNRAGIEFVSKEQCMEIEKIGLLSENFDKFPFKVIEQDENIGILELIVYVKKQ